MLNGLFFASIFALAPAPREGPWILRHPPEPHQVEVGVSLGLFSIPRDFGGFEAADETEITPHRQLPPFAPTFGIRFGYAPLRRLGFEVEGAGAPTHARASPIVDLESSAKRATLWSLRAHVIIQAATWSISPFFLAGAGVLGVRSRASVLGNDTDPALHVGGGLRMRFGSRSLFRIDFRDVLAPAGATGSLTAHSLEATLGLAIVLTKPPEGRKK
jgi:hypothetical protein